jgi:hypothetical protein
MPKVQRSGVEEQPPRGMSIPSRLGGRRIEFEMGDL